MAMRHRLVPSQLSRTSPAQSRPPSFLQRRPWHREPSGSAATWEAQLPRRLSTAFRASPYPAQHRQRTRSCSGTAQRGLRVHCLEAELLSPQPTPGQCCKPSTLESCPKVSPAPAAELLRFSWGIQVRVGPPGVERPQASVSSDRCIRGPTPEPARPYMSAKAHPDLGGQNEAANLSSE